VAHGDECGDRDGERPCIHSRSLAAMRRLTAKSLAKVPVGSMKNLKHKSFRKLSRKKALSRLSSSIHGLNPIGWGLWVVLQSLCHSVHISTSALTSNLHLRGFLPNHWIQSSARETSETRETRLVRGTGPSGSSSGRQRPKSESRSLRRPCTVVSSRR
jgi:hypothetical protein